MTPISVYFIQPYCDRCERDLSKGRAISFFTRETICLNCYKKEDAIRSKITETVGRDADLEYEGCGFLPKIRSVERPNEEERVARATSMTGKIKSKKEAYRIVIETEARLKTGLQLTTEQGCRYQFAKIFLNQIAKRRKTKQRRSGSNR